MNRFTRALAPLIAGLLLQGYAALAADTDSGKKSFAIEIADDEIERERGLMFRTRMDDAHGMLFVFQETQPVAFWMKNTIMPLDLVFIDASGKVEAVRQGKPFSEDGIGPDGAVRFVLELKAGIADKTGIEAGDRVHHPAIDAIAGGG